eukprot:CAMPEP_0177711414 /NCGR_PEP_ID=MMETSP0484_2-20121128/11849_1 /TAXON_ID=354590 /ORGANISM="Rhodomonas lens, Strain RHODO" /LENGTH=209 /DNA_ID=CAMNT_0019223147 /DNA_START=9 /DNA_END=638 /DNA_ORIENTATION=-
MAQAKVLLATALALSSFDAAEGFLASGPSLLRAPARGLGKTAVTMTCGNEPSVSRREAAAVMLGLALATPTASWAEEEKKLPRFQKVREELLKEAEEAEKELKGKKPESGALRMQDLREKMFKTQEEDEVEMAKEAAEMKHVSMRELREQMEEYEKNFKHESEEVALAVEVASNEHVADKLVEPFFIFSPFVFLWSGFKLFNKKWNLGQ